MQSLKITTGFAEQKKSCCLRDVTFEISHVILINFKPCKFKIDTLLRNKGNSSQNEMSRLLFLAISVKKNPTAIIRGD